MRNFQMISIRGFLELFKKSSTADHLDTAKRINKGFGIPRCSAELRMDYSSIYKTGTIRL